MSYDSDSSSSTNSTIVNSPIVYVKNNVDYSDYALDIIENELTYYDYIKSYTTDNDVVLFICEHGIVVKSGTYDNTGKLTDNETNKEFDTIVDWLIDYKGHNLAFEYLFDNLFIGEDLVPFWKILVDLKEEDDANEDNENSMKDFEKKMFHILMVLYILLLLILYLIIQSAY